MRKLVITSFAAFALCAAECAAQSTSEVQPVSASRDAVMAPAAAVIVTDSAAVNVSSQKDASSGTNSATEVPSDGSGQPIPSARKPD
jgi:hypothetical protein